MNSDGSDMDTAEKPSCSKSCRDRIDADFQKVLSSLDNMNQLWVEAPPPHGDVTKNVMNEKFLSEDAKAWVRH